MGLKKFNEKLAKRNFGLELVRGKGFHYWTGPGSELLQTSSVMVPYFYQLSEETWMKLAEQTASEIYRLTRDGE